MKLLVSIVVCAIISMITSFFFPNFNPGDGIVSTLYTVSGIMFSIGMSLTITSNTSGVKNPRIRKGIRKELSLVRNHFIWCFSIASLLYIFLNIDPQKGDSAELPIYGEFALKYSHLLVFTMAYAIIFFVINFLAIQRLNIEIEDALNEEE